MVSEKTKIFIVAVILILLVGGIYFVRNRRIQNQSSQSQESEKTMEVVPTEMIENNIFSIRTDKTSFQAGENFNAKILFKAPGKKIFGSDVILLYDPEFLSANNTSISVGDFFDNNPRKTADGKNGIIKITSYGGKDQILDENPIELGSIDFKALKQGVSHIDFSFVKGKTNTSTLVEAKTSQNILEKTVGLNFNISQ